jgi:hypothetical protein
MPVFRSGISGPSVRHSRGGFIAVQGSGLCLFAQTDLRAKPLPDEPHAPPITILPGGLRRAYLAVPLFRWICARCVLGTIV